MFGLSVYICYKSEASDSRIRDITSLGPLKLDSSLFPARNAETLCV